VTRKGLHIHSLFKSSHLAWSDIEGFGVAGWTQWHGPFRQRHRLVGMNFKRGSAPYEEQGKLIGLSTAISGYHGALPDNYGYKHEGLADLLNQYLEVHRKADPA
ncbi:MAG: hypothetical protein ABI599_04730, partial [Flavobacteriales bacterium]